MVCSLILGLVLTAQAAASRGRPIELVTKDDTGSYDKITEQNWSHVFRLNPPASEYPKAINSFLTEVIKPATVAILYEKSNFGQSSSNSFAEQCEKMGFKVVLKEGYDSGAVDFKPLPIKVKAANPDPLYMVSYLMDAGLLMRQSKELDN